MQKLFQIVHTCTNKVQQCTTKEREGSGGKPLKKQTLDRIVQLMVVQSRVLINSRIDYCRLVRCTEKCRDKVQG